MIKNEILAVVYELKLKEARNKSSCFLAKFLITFRCTLLNKFLFVVGFNDVITKLAMCIECHLVVALLGSPGKFDLLIPLISHT